MPTRSSTRRQADPRHFRIQRSMGSLVDRCRRARGCCSRTVAVVSHSADRVDAGVDHRPTPRRLEELCRHRHNRSRRKGAPRTVSGDDRIAARRAASRDGRFGDLWTQSSRLRPGSGVVLRVFGIMNADDSIPNRSGLGRRARFLRGASKRTALERSPLTFRTREEPPHDVASAAWI